MVRLPLCLLLTSLVPATAPGDLPTTYEMSIAGLSGPADLAWTPGGELLVLERDAHRVRRLTADGTTVRTWGGRGSGDGELLFPQGLGLAPDGCVWVADTGNRRVVRFSGDGEFLSSFDGSGTEQGPFLRPVDVAIRAGRVAVADTGHHGVLRFNDELEPLFKGAFFQELTGFVEFWIRHASLSLMEKREALCRRTLPANN